MPASLEGRGEVGRSASPSHSFPALPKLLTPVIGQAGGLRREHRAALLHLPGNTPDIKSQSLARLCQCCINICVTGRATVSDGGETQFF